MANTTRKETEMKQLIRTISGVEWPFTTGNIEELEKLIQSEITKAQEQLLDELEVTSTTENIGESWVNFVDVVRTDVIRAKRKELTQPIGDSNE